MRVASPAILPRDSARSHGPRMEPLSKAEPVRYESILASSAAPGKTPVSGPSIRKKPLRLSPQSPRPATLPGFVLTQPAFIFPLPLCPNALLSPLPEDAILSILPMKALDQMGRIYAGRIVARVANDAASEDRPIMLEFPSETMSTHPPTIGQPGHSVAAL